jgi:adenylate cyclase
MPVEIERKFLVRTEGWRAQAHSRVLLRQRYVANTARASVRARVAGDRATLSLKAMTPGIARAEYEYEIPVADAAAILDTLCEPPGIEKWRHRVRHAGHDWEVDEFVGANAGLVLAEIELARADLDPPLPDWAGAEVTDDVRYYNFMLAERPWPTWARAERP